MLLIVRGWEGGMGLGVLALTCVLAAVGWLMGLIMVRHSFLGEVRFMAFKLLTRLPWLRRCFPAFGG
ncbi:MAG: hypothetical protein EON58_16150 [Alphaproteobacteria bacterium]|nr:MAG: hypothetical protein EON58_16150 [Alphaproteobacteria bacterium]